MSRLTLLVGQGTAGRTPSAMPAVPLSKKGMIILKTSLSEDISIANAEYMARRVMKSGNLSFIFPADGAVAIKTAATLSGEWGANELARAIVEYGTQGERAEINIANHFDPNRYLYLNEYARYYDQCIGRYPNRLFWELQGMMADFQDKYYFQIEQNQMIMVKEYADAYRKHLAARQADPNYEQFLPFVFRGAHMEKLSSLPYRERMWALRSVIDFGVQGIKHARSIHPEVDDVIFKICASIRHEQEDFMDLLQREQNEESLYNEFLSCPPENPESPEELEKFEAFLKRIYDPKHKSKYNSFWWYKDYTYKAYSLLGQDQRHNLLHATMCYGTEGIRGLYKINDLEVALPFIQIKASIKASQNRYCKAQIDGSKGGRPEKYPRKLFVELAKRGFCFDEMAAYLGCSERTVERKISRDEVGTIMDAEHNYRHRRPHRPDYSSNPMKDPMLIPMLRNTGNERFKDLDENNIPKYDDWSLL